MRKLEWTPIYILLLAVSLTICVSAICSLMEAALYAVPLPHVKHLSESGSRSGKILMKFKEEISQPISAILILNTVSNTGGASIAGWAGASVFSETGLLIFSASFVLSILYLSEIVPKIVGVSYCREVSTVMALPLSWLVKILSPLVALSQALSRRLGQERGVPTVSEEEVLSMAAIGTEEGALDHFEGSVVVNVIGLDRLTVEDILTPRVVVFRIKEDLTLRDLRGDLPSWNFSRVPIYSESEPDHLTGYVIQRDIYREVLGGNLESTVKEISRPIHTVPELMRADKLLLQMFEKKEHICAVVDEHGGLSGIITLEDIIEEIVGREIVDEYDTVSDLRTFARILRVVKGRKKPR